MPKRSRKLYLLSAWRMVRLLSPMLIGPQHRQVAIIAALATFLLGIRVSAQQAEHPISIDTNLVTIPVIVADRRGRSIYDLKSVDFNILEDGRQQELAFFASNRQPINVLLLIENGCSLTGFRANLLKIAETIADQMEGDDRLALATICDESPLRFTFGLTKKSELKRPVRFESNLDTPFTFTYDILEQSFEYMGRFKGPKAIILLSNGAMYGRNASANKILYLAEETDTSVYPIRFGDAPATFPDQYSALDSYRRTEYDSTWTSAENPSSTSPKPIKQAPIPRLARPGKEMDKLVKQVRAFFQALADKTGGRSFEFGSMENMDSTVHSILEEIGARYTLGYIPTETPKNGERRKITVKVNVPQAVVRARKEVVYRKAKR